MKRFAAPSRALVAAAIAMAACQSGAVAAATTEEELKDLREQVRQLRDLYERRLSELEGRLRQAEQSAQSARSEATAQTARDGTRLPSTSGGGATVAASPPAAMPAGAGAIGEAAANPGISAILNGVYGNLSRDPSTYRISGFAPTGGEVAPPNRGASLGESELVFSANIDRHFRATMVAALAPDDSVGVEEASIQTLGLGNGFSLKFGRFFSAVSYLNEIHAHAWDFTDTSLASKAFLGGKLGDDGLQLKWVAPTDLYFDIGAELGRGRKFPGGPDGGRNKNGFGAASLFAHLGGDWGTGAAWQLGLSHLRTRAQGRSWTDADATGTDVTNDFTGASRLWVAGGVLKWAPQGNASSTSFKLQGEYFRRTEEGELRYDTGAASLGTQAGAYRSKQSGWYAQAVYQFMPEWRVGYRFDRLDAGNTSIGLVDSGALTAADFPILQRHNPSRNSLMVDWSPSEFSRVRLQFSRDRSQTGSADNQVFLQYVMNLGAHGAHKF